MDRITGDDMVVDVATYLSLADGDAQAEWDAFQALREEYRAAETDTGYRLSRGDQEIEVGPPSLDTLTAVYDRDVAADVDRAADRWRDERRDGRDRDKIASETRDDVVSVLNSHYRAFGTMDTFVYRDQDSIVVLEEDAEQVDPVERPQEKVSLEEMAEFYRMARDVYGDVEACRELFGLMREMYGVGEFGYEVFHDLRRDHTLLFDREDVRLVDPREERHRVAGHVDIPDVIDAEEPDPDRTPRIDFDGDDTVFEQLFDTDTFGADV